MKKKASKKQKTQAATAQNRCIWMTAGIISFKLCPLNYDCEHCDFDGVMRSQVRSKGGRAKVKRHKPETPAPSERLPMASSDSKKPPLFFTYSVDEVDEELYLHSTHLWVRQTEGQKWKLGIDKLLAYVLPPPVEVESYGLNTKVIQNQLFGKVHTQAGTIPLTAPLSGCLGQANPKLADHPELVQQDPYGEGWLAEVDWFQNHSELENFYSGLAGRRFLEEEAQHLKFLLKHRGIEINNIGDTLPDGGVHIKYLYQVLPGPVCLRLAVELMTSGKQAW
jgi:glycine cleavage system H protein